jgi:prevent-host-death family protein
LWLSDEVVGMHGADRRGLDHRILTGQPSAMWAVLSDGHWVKLSLVYLEVAMDSVINIHEAKTHLSKIVDEVAAGAEVIIAKAGKPMARLSPISAPARPKKPGLLKGKIKVPDDFNEPLDDVIADFEGR